jgi:cation-transporting ATPase 13A2
MSVEILGSVTGQAVIQMLLQIALFFGVKEMSWYTEPVYDVGDYTPSYEGNVLFLLTIFIYILSSLVFSVGPPFRAQFWTNSKFLFDNIIMK